MVMANSRGSHLLLELGSWQLGNLTRWWWVCLPDAVIWWGPIYWEMMLLFDCSECATLPSQCLRWPGCTPDSRSTQPTSSTQPGTFQQNATVPNISVSQRELEMNISEYWENGYWNSLSHKCLINQPSETVDSSQLIASEEIL